ncbi:MAG: prolyl oligopeptidase family serine peptidase [Thomasclavelia sp.]
MKKIKKLFAAFVSMALVLTTYCAPLSAVEPTTTDTYECELHGEVTDAGQVISKMVIDYGAGKKVSNVTEDTFTVHATASTEAIREGTDVTSYGDYDIDRKIVKVETNGQYVTIYFDMSEGATLAYLSSGRNYPADLTYTVTQNQPIALTAADGRDLGSDYVANYTCDTTKIIDEEVAKFESVKIDGGINYQYYDAGSADSLIVWFHGNGEGDHAGSQNNVSQMLANRGTVAWATAEAQEIFGGAHVMAFQAPDTWYLAQKDNLLKQAYNEIKAVIAEKGIDPEKVYVSGCSAGGYMTTRMLIAYPNLFNAAMINCPALDVADARGGETPTDEELASLKNSDTSIWLVQGVTDSSVATDKCSKRMFDILTEGQAITKTTVAQEIASDYTTWETADNKYKLSLYETVEVTADDGTVSNKLEFAEDYDQDGTNTLVQYSDHWSWIYTLNNNPTAADGTHIWQWAANYKVDGKVFGDQKAYIIGDDWGPAVTKTIITLNKTVAADSLDKDDFAVAEVKNAMNWKTVTEEIATTDRQVLNVYTSDAEGNRVDSDSNIIAIEMYVDPNTGSPFIYRPESGFNYWCETYELHVTLANDSSLTLADGTNVTTLAVESAIDLKGDDKIVPQVDGIFDINQKYTANDGTVYNFADYTPAADDKKNALVIWLHGAGEGTDKGVNDSYIDLLGNEVTAFVSDEFQELFEGAYVLVPQAPTMWMDDGTGAYQNGDKGSCYKDSLFEMIEAYVADHPDIDPNRIIIGGCSNGGYMTMEMILAHPDYFAAAFPICEAFEDQYITDEQIESLVDLPIWFTYAENDDTVDPTKCAIPTIERLLKAGAKNVHVSVFEDVHDTTGRFVDEDGNPHQYSGHWSWIYFDNNECYEGELNAWQWLSKQVKSTATVVEPGVDTPNADTTKPGATTSVKTGDDVALMGLGILMVLSAGTYTVARKRFH